MGATVLTLGVAAPAGADPEPTQPTRAPVRAPPAGTGSGAGSAAQHAWRMRLLSEDPTGQTNSDMAFWGTRAYVGNYNGFRIYDISGLFPAPARRLHLLRPAERRDGLGPRPRR
jgi:hypothetical protein